MLALDLKDDTRSLIKVLNLSNNIVIVTPLGSGQTVSFENRQYYPLNGNLRFHVIYFEYSNTLIRTEITPTEKNIDLYVCLRYSQRQTIQGHDLNATVANNRGSVLTPTAHDK